MSGAHRRHAEVLLFLLAGLFLLAATLIVAGCGSQSDKYEGTWTQASLPQSDPETPIIIKKVGDTYAFTDPSGGSYASIIHSNPTGSGQATLYSMMLSNGATATKDGDMLKLPVADSTVEITVSGDIMTIVVPGVDGVFTFSRATTSPSPAGT